MSALMNPVPVFFLIILFSLMYVWRKQKENRRRLLWVIVPFLLLTLMSTRPFAHIALGSLEWRNPPAEDVPPDAGAIVVLAGSMLAADAVRIRPELGPATLNRCLHAKILNQANPDRIILLSGGLVEGEENPSAAAVMREFMLSQGIKPSQIVVEERSMTTYENAAECCKLLRERGVSRIVLVTDATHMTRAAACFRKQGMDVVPSPCGHIANNYRFIWLDVFPGVKSAGQVETAWHEWLGMAVYRVRGYI